jgi:hypothetical protein
MLELEDQLAEYGTFLDALDPDAVVDLAAPAAVRSTLRTMVLIAACVAVIAATTVWALTQLGSSRSARVSPADTPATTAQQPPPPSFDVKAFFDQPRIPVADAHGNTRGTIPTSAYMPERLTGAPHPAKPDNTPVPVITDEGKLDGYWIPCYGFAERAVVEVAHFDPDDFCAREEAKWAAEHPEAVRRQQERIAQLEGTATTTAPAAP